MVVTLTLDYAEPPPTDRGPFPHSIWECLVPQKVLWQHRRPKDCKEKQILFQDHFKARLEDELKGDTIVLDKSWTEHAESIIVRYGVRGVADNDLLCRVSAAFEWKNAKNSSEARWLDLARLSVIFPCVETTGGCFDEDIHVNELQASILNFYVDEKTELGEKYFPIAEVLVELTALIVYKARQRCGSASIERFDASYDGFSLAIVAGPVNLTWEPYHFDGPSSSEDSLRLWVAVESGSVEGISEVIAQLRVQGERLGVDAHEFIQRLFAHRRKMRTVSGRELVGPLLLFATLLANTSSNSSEEQLHRLDVLRTLLHSRADPNIRYFMLAGSAAAHFYGPLIFYCTKHEVLDALLRDGIADVNAVGFLNYHVHCTCLWSACWRKEADVVKTLVDNLADIDNGCTWSVDTPPLAHLSQNGYATITTAPSLSLRQAQSSATHCRVAPDAERTHPEPVMLNVLQLAVQRGMGDEVKMLIDRGIRIQSSSLQGEKYLRKNDLRDLFKQLVKECNCDVLGPIVKAIAQKYPIILLDSDLTGAGREDHHRARFVQMIYSTVVKDNKSLAQLQKEVQNIASGIGPVEEPCERKFSTGSFRLGSLQQEASSSSDFSTLGPEEKAEQLHKHITALIRHAPLAATKLLDEVYLQHPKVVQANRNPLPVQCRITNDDLLNTVYVTNWQWSRPNPEGKPWQWQLDLVGDGSQYHSCFSDIKVLCLPGSIRLETLIAISGLSKTVAGRALTTSTSLRAIVSFSWWAWGRPRVIAILSITVLQVMALLSWACCLRMPTEVLITFMQVLDIEFVVPKFCWAIYSAAVLAELCDHVQYVIGMMVLDGGQSRGEVFHQVFNARRLVVWPARGIAMALVVGTWGDWGCESRVFCQIPLSIVQTIVWIRLLLLLRAFRGIGVVLIPIIDIIREPAMWAIIVVMGFFLAAITAFALVEWRAFEFKELLVRVGENFIVGESEIFDKDEFTDSDLRYMFIFSWFFIFAIVIMNIFIAITSDSYHKNKQELVVQGSLLTNRNKICSEALMNRRMLLSMLRILGLQPAKGLRIYVSTWSILAFIAFIADVTSKFDVSALVLLCVFFALANFAMMRVSLIRSPENEEDCDQSNWVLKAHFLWICEAKEEDIDGDETDRDILNKIKNGLRQLDERQMEFDEMQEAATKSFDERWQSLSERLRQDICQNIEDRLRNHQITARQSPETYIDDAAIVLLE